MPGGRTLREPRPVNRPGRRTRLGPASPSGDWVTVVVRIVVGSLFIACFSLVSSRFAADWNSTHHRQFDIHDLGTDSPSDATSFSRPVPVCVMPRTVMGPCLTLNSTLTPEPLLPWYSSRPRRIGLWPVIMPDQAGFSFCHGRSPGLRVASLRSYQRGGPGRVFAEERQVELVIPVGHLRRGLVVATDEESALGRRRQ